LGQSTIRTISIPGSTSVDVYEGFFDFLSALTYNRLLRPVCTTIILNSTANLKQALSAFDGAKEVNCYFDNDNAGRSSVAKLKALELPVKDRSDLYAKHNDLNDMLIHTS